MNANPIIAGVASVNKHLGKCPKYEWFEKISQKPTRVYIDKFGRKISEYAHDAFIVAENKGGSMVVTTPKMTVTFDKSGNIVREVTPCVERIFLPNGSSIEIARINGARVGDFFAYTKKHPDGIEVKTHKTDGYSKYSLAVDYASGKAFHLCSNKEGIAVMEEKHWLRKVANLPFIHPNTAIYSPSSTYSQELVRAILKENF